MKRLICAVLALVLVLSSDYASAADVAEHQWVRVSENGTVQGRVVVPRSEGISAARGAKVSLVDQFGKFASASVESDKTGRFTLTNVTPGVYTLLIQGEDAFACCAMHVVSSDVPISDQFEIAAGAVEFKVVRSALVRYLPPGQATKVVFDPSSNPMTTDRASMGESIRVSQFEGGLRGRLTRAGFTEDLGVKDANVLIYRDGVQIARTVTDQTGNFKIADLAPGSYSVLGSGRDGFGLMGLELINPLVTATASSDDSASEATFVAQTDEVSDMFIMQVAPGPITVIDDRLVDERDLGPVVPLDGTGYALDSAPMGGSIGGGGGGAGGGIGGGGRLGGLALIGGAAALAIGLSDDDDVVTTPPVISPAAPPAVIPTP